jgi:hypothetical protein
MDPRLTLEKVNEVRDGEGNIVPGDYLVAVAPVELADGRVLFFRNPQAVVFSLHEAARHRKGGEKLRQRVTTQVAKRQDGDWEPRDHAAAIDCISEMAAAVLFSFAALEAFANHTIDQLDEDAVVNVERRGSEVDIRRDDLVRTLSITEKLDRAVPALTGRASAKGSAEWRGFVELRRLRDGIVHIKDRAYSSDPKDPAVFGRLIRGDASTCDRDALALIDKLRPEFLSEHSRTGLDE